MVKIESFITSGKISLKEADIWVNLNCADKYDVLGNKLATNCKYQGIACEG